MSDRPPSHPLVIGHRGASGYRPEHTRSAYELAFALGADAVEPDIVSTRDGVLVLRHENEISGTTDVAAHPEFQGLRTTKRIDDVELTGWFTEDFTWEQLSTLRARERLPGLRKSSATFDGRYPILRLADLFEIIDATTERVARPLGMVAEIKHATYFESIGLPLDELFATAVNDAGWNQRDGRLTIESFERTVLASIHARGIDGKRVYLIEATGKPFDLVARFGARATRYADDITESGLFALGGVVDGVSVAKSLILQTDAGGRVVGASELVDEAHAAGLEIYTWTLRPENAFLAATFRRGRLKADYGYWQAEFRTIMSTGIDGVFADQPDLAVAVRDELSAR
ncbi:glycerophosphodiester phosphodiesterase family protein [Glaciibacter sp. 2TAF33]|uniref:glycerophosphodiester phosphodiesterase family protein n=1 Tax=Glaciibacter sp. 2TAF33 TaxID=3233015 RepID=UPI003F906F84